MLLSGWTRPSTWSVRVIVGPPAHSSTQVPWTLDHAYFSPASDRARRCARPGKRHVKRESIYSNSLTIPESSLVSSSYPMLFLSFWTFNNSKFRLWLMIWALFCFRSDTANCSRLSIGSVKLGIKNVVVVFLSYSVKFFCFILVSSIIIIVIILYAPSL